MNFFGKNLFLFALSLFLTAFSPVHCPAQSRSVVHDKVADWLSGRLSGVSVTQDGVLLPGLEAAETIELGVEGVNVVWSAVDDGEGGAFLGTGPEGKVVHVSKSGEVYVLADLEQPHVFAVARGDGNAVWAAASPGGALYKLVKDEQPVKWWGGGAEYIWEIIAGKDDVVVATGRPAQLVRVTAQEQSSVLCEVPDTHVRCLAGDGQGGFFLGTSGRGLLLRWDAKKLTSLATADRSEIRQVALVEGGEVFFLAVGDATSSGTGSRAGRGSSAGGSGNSGGSAGSSRASGESFDVFASLGGEREPGAQRGTPEIRGDLWQWKAQEGARKVASLPGQPHVFFPDADVVMVSAGSRGYVFSVDVGNGRLSVVAQAASNYVTCLLPGSEGLRLFGSFPASLMRLRKADKGSFESAVIDAGSEAHWGGISVLGEAVSLQRRFGWTPEPDSLWTEWSDVSSTKDLDRMRPRFSQYRLVPGEGGVRRVEVFYTLMNRAPQFKELRVLASGEEFRTVESPPGGPGQQSLDQLIRGEQQNRNALSGGAAPSSQNKAGGDNSLGSVRVAQLGGTSFRTLIFVVDEPNGDAMEFLVEYRKVNHGDFTVLKSGLEKPFFNFDTRGWSDGWYEFRVTAEDRPPLGQKTLSAQMLSEPVLVDNTAPSVELLQKSDTEMTIRVKDNYSVLSSVMISLDGVIFQNALPKDGVLDSKEEIFVIPLSDRVKGGVFVRAEDLRGNQGGGHFSTEVK